MYLTLLFFTGCSWTWVHQLWQVLRTNLHMPENEICRNSSASQSTAPSTRSNCYKPHYQVLLHLIMRSDLLVLLMCLIKQSRTWFEMIKVMSVKIIIFWVVTSHGWLGGNQCFKGVCCLCLLCPKGGGNSFFWNAGIKPPHPLHVITC